MNGKWPSSRSFFNFIKCRSDSLSREISAMVSERNNNDRLKSLEQLSLLLFSKPKKLKKVFYFCRFLRQTFRVFSPQMDLLRLLCPKGEMKGARIQKLKCSTFNKKIFRFSRTIMLLWHWISIKWRKGKRWDAFDYFLSLLKTKQIYLWLLQSIYYDYWSTFNIFCIWPNLFSSWFCY